MFIAVLFITAGIASRLIPHMPNFAPLVGVALFSGVVLKAKHGYLIPVGIYVASDLIIGLHNTVFFTWGSIILIYFGGRFLARHKSFSNICAFTLASSLLFFIVTNLGVWIMGWYPHTAGGLLSCFACALPFFRTTLLSSCLYSGVLFGSYELLIRMRHLPVQETTS